MKISKKIKLGKIMFNYKKSQFYLTKFFFTNSELQNNENITQKNFDNNKKTKFYKMTNCKTDFDFKVFLFQDENCKEKSSFLHDIPYKNPDKTFNFVYEVPYGETAKMEMSKEKYNPIHQDTKKNKLTNQKYLRYYKLTPLFNYGFIPQTWEDPTIKFRNQYEGDNDPVDVIELSISNKISEISDRNNINLSINNSRNSIGDVSRIHVIGSFCLIDQDEVDWKILGINADICDREKALKWIDHEENKIRLNNIMKWFKIYKTFEGKKENIILDNDKIFSPEETLEIIEENHKSYKKLKIKFL